MGSLRREIGTEPLSPAASVSSVESRASMCGVSLRLEWHGPSVGVGPDERRVFLETGPKELSSTRSSGPCQFCTGRSASYGEDGRLHWN